MPLTTRSLILARTEVTYGVDPVATVAADALLTTNPEVEIVGSTAARAVVLPHYGTLAGINVGEGIKIRFSVEARGSGAAGTAPRIAALLRACNMTMTTSAGVSNAFALNSSQEGESVALVFFRDGVRHIALGCVGTFKLTCKANEPAMLDFEFTGLYAGGHASAAAFPTGIIYDAPAVSPPIFRSASFNMWGIGTANAIIQNFSFDLANSIAKRSDANAASGARRYGILNREVKGECDPEVIAIGTYNPWTMWDATTAGAITATIGNIVGNRIVVDMPNVVKDTVGYGDREGTLTYGISFSAKPTVAAGNNEVSLLFN